jgi:hypothetical protein
MTARVRLSKKNAPINTKGTKKRKMSEVNAC